LAGCDAFHTSGRLPGSVTDVIANALALAPEIVDGVGDTRSCLLVVGRRTLPQVLR
jgi:hypothetical protein